MIIYEKSAVKKPFSPKTHSQFGNRTCLDLMKQQESPSIYPIQRMGATDIQAIIDYVYQVRGFLLTSEQVMDILSNAFNTSGERFTRSWLQRVDYSAALQVVLATVTKTGPKQQYVVSFGDKGLQDGLDALEQGKIPHTTYLEPAPDIEAAKQQILDAGGTVTGGVMIRSTDIIQGPAGAETPFSLPSPGSQTTAVFSYPWTSGRATSSETVRAVSALTADYGSQMKREDVARMDMTAKWYQDRMGSQIRAPHRKAYTTSFPGWDLTIAEHSAPDKPHIKTMPGQSTVHSATEGVTFHYSNFSVQFKPLLDAANNYLKSSGSDGDRFDLLLRSALMNDFFPAALKDAVLARMDDLTACARLVLDYVSAKAPSSPLIKDFGSFHPGPSDDDTYWKEGMGDIQYL